MSAICGLLELDDAPVEPRRVEAMVRAMGRRGAHRVGIVTDGAIGLGHGALFTTACARDEVQPLTWPRAGLTLVADVRLDAREELARALGLEGPVMDGALILAAYAAWGPSCAARLTGDFAFALWDAPRRRLVLARDAFGARPLRWLRTPRRFAFASDTIGLRASGEPLGPRDDGRIADYLLGGVFEGSDKTSTFHAGVKRLAPAHVLVLERGRVTETRAWTPDPERRVRFRSDGELLEAFRATFDLAVRDRLRSASGVGAMLSGGLDSSAIVASARDQRARAGEPVLPTFSAISPDPAACHEGPFIQAVIAAGGLDPTLVATDALAPLAAEVRRHLEATDDPFDMGGIDVPLAMFHAAARRGLHVVLDGVDGDLVTSHGRQTVRYALAEGRPVAAWREAAGHAAYFQEDPGATFLHHGLVPWLWYGVRPWLPTAVVRAQRWAMRRDLAAELVRTSPIAPELRERLDLPGRVRRMQPPLGDAARPRRPVDDHLHRLEWAVIPAALERYDRVAVGQGVEARHPFFDRRVAELCLALPWDRKTSGGWPKVLLRRAMAGALPEPVLRRRWSENLNGIIRRGLLPLLRGWILDSLASGLDTTEGIINRTAIFRALDDVGANNFSRADEIWQLVAFSAWSKTWLRA